MRNKTVRMKRLRAQRILDDFMRMPLRLVVGLPDYRESNWKALQENRLWAIPEPATELVDLLERFKRT